MKFQRIYADAQGASHFEEVELDFSADEFVPGKPAFGVTPAYAVAGAVFAKVPLDWDGGWHPTPRRQFVVILSGALDIRTCDDEVRRFTQGNVFLLEDTIGEGHHTTMMGETEGTLLFAWLDPPR